MNLSELRSKEWASLAERALIHFRNKTSDRADDVGLIPVDAYLDQQRFEKEKAILFGKLPLGIGLSIELPEPGSYVARTVMGLPLLLTRTKDGSPRVFFNVCRHRGARLCSPGSGKQTRFSCPYHAWVFDNEGRLTGMYGKQSFGDINTDDYALKDLPCAERSGIIWANLSGEAFDIDAWLGDFAVRLDMLELGNWHLHEVRELESPGWKACLDGYLENYHHDTVHRGTVGLHTIGNLLVHDTFGPHQRLTFARPNIGELDGVDRKDWDAPAHIRMIHSIFPNMSISGILGEHCLISQIWPTDRVDKTITRQFLLTGHKPETAAEKEAAEAFSAMTLQAVRDEDYALVSTIQEGMPSGANENFTFGRCEPGLQHYHGWVERIASGDNGGLA